MTKRIKWEDALPVGCEVNGRTVVGWIRGYRGELQMTLLCECGRARSVNPSKYFWSPQKCQCVMHWKHGCSTRDNETPEYNVWMLMRRRCTRPSCKAFANYGGRGITVCDRWLHSFSNFINDMGFRPTSRHTLERVNNDLGYSPENCVWATRKEQCNNKRNNTIISAGGVTKTLSQWSEITGISHKTLSSRLRYGWAPEEVLEVTERKMDKRFPTRFQPNRASRITSAVVFILCVFTSVIAFGQTAKAVIVGPKETISGDMIKLDGSQSQGGKYSWKILKSDKAFYATDGGAAIIFSAGVREATVFSFALAVAGTNANGGVDLDIAFHDVQVNPLYPPKPPNPTPPVPVPGRVTGAILLYESEDTTQEIQATILRLRNEKITRLKVLDKDARKSDSDEPVKQVQDAVKFLGNKPLPRLVAIDESGSFVADADVGSYDDVQRLLKSWGL